MNTELNTELNAELNAELSTELSTPTPRTDAEATLVRSTENGVLVHAAFARTLERELAESRNAERLARVQLGNAREKVQVLREALMALIDQQNGADRPLCRAHWQMAMDEAGLALATTEVAK
jgi:hypothetical protein